MVVEQSLIQKDTLSFICFLAKIVVNEEMESVKTHSPFFGLVTADLKIGRSMNCNDEETHCLRLRCILCQDFVDFQIRFRIKSEFHEVEHYKHLYFWQQ